MSDFYDDDDDDSVSAGNYDSDIYGELDDVDDVLKEVEDLNIPDFDQHPLVDEEGHDDMHSLANKGESVKKKDNK